VLCGKYEGLDCFSRDLLEYLVANCNDQFVMFFLFFGEFVMFFLFWVSLVFC
jgi:hypothetical protein